MPIDPYRVNLHGGFLQGSTDQNTDPCFRQQQQQQLTSRELLGSSEAHPHDGTKHFRNEHDEPGTLARACL